MGIVEKRFRKANPVKIDSFVTAMVENLGIGKDIAFKKIVECWPEIAGPAGARNTRPVSLKNGLLIISVSSPAWNAQARFYKQTFLNNIRQCEPDGASEIRDIRFVLERS